MGASELPRSRLEMLGSIGALIGSDRAQLTGGRIVGVLIVIGGLVRGQGRPRMHVGEFVHRGDVVGLRVGEGRQEILSDQAEDRNRGSDRGSLVDVPNRGDGGRHGGGGVAVSSDSIWCRGKTVHRIPRSGKTIVFWYQW